MNKRAVSDEQKQDKQLGILQAAAKLFARSSFERLSMARIAETAGVAKGTVFLYFPTKEELFMTLAEHSFEEWLRELRALFDTLVPGRESSEGVADAILVTLAGRQDLLRLLSILHTRIEENIALQTAIRFRRRLAAGMTSIAARLGTIFPALNSSEALEAVNGIYMLLIGVQHLTAPSGTTREALREGNVSVFPDDFSSAFRRVCRDYLEGRLSRCDGTM